MNIVVEQSRKRTPVISTYKGHKAVIWPVPRQPETINVDDRVYVLSENVVLHYYLFKGFVIDPKCESTGQIFPGLNMLLQVPPVQVNKTLEKPFPKFHGFKYVSDL